MSVKIEIDSGDLEIRALVAEFVMDTYNVSQERGGHFWFDIHDAEDLLDAIIKCTGTIK